MLVKVKWKRLNTGNNIRRFRAKKQHCLLQKPTFPVNGAWKIQTRDQMTAKPPVVTTSSRKKFNWCLVPWPAPCTALKASGEDEGSLVTEDLQANMVLLGPGDCRDLKEKKGLKEIRDPRDLKATRAPKDPRAILVNPFQPLLLLHLQCPRLSTEQVQPHFSAKLEETLSLRSRGWNRIQVCPQTNEYLSQVVAWLLQMWCHKTVEYTHAVQGISLVCRRHQLH